MRAVIVGAGPPDHPNTRVYEKTAGEPHGRPRIKLIRVADLGASSRAMPRG